MKKLISIILTLALIVTFVPLPVSSVVEAAATTVTDKGTYFLFPNESYTFENARVTTDERVNLSGTVNGISDFKTITYTVSKVVKNGTQETTIESREGLVGNITQSGTKITVSNIQLYDGMNRITFQGNVGISPVPPESVYIEYRNGPTLQDLKVNNQELKENEATVITSSNNNSTNKDSINVSISGIAKNAEQVKVTTDSGSWTYNVSRSSGWKFTAGAVNIKRGTNVVKISSINGSQVFETERLITFFNGNVTFHNVNLVNVDGTTGSKNKINITTNPNISMATDADMQKYSILEGSVTIPTTALMKDNNGDVINPVITIKTSAYPTLSATAQIVSIDQGSAATTIQYSYDNTGGYLAFGKNRISVEISGISTNVLPNNIVSETYTVEVTNNSTPFFQTVNYLEGYDVSMAGNDSAIFGLPGSPLNGAGIYRLPTAIEFVVVNGAVGEDLIEIKEVKNSAGKTASTVPVLKFLAKEPVSVDVGSGQAMRYIYQLDQLPFSGEQKIEFVYDKNGANKSYTATVSVVHGPYFKFDKAYNGMIVNANTNKDDWKVSVFQNDLGRLAGDLLNVPSDSKLTNDNVSLYLNNVRMHPLNETQLGLNRIEISGTDDTSFASRLALGENKIRLEYRDSKTSYTNEIKISIVPKNLPIVEKLFPYSNTQSVKPYPIPNSELFEQKGGVFYTREQSANVFGTFDFIDLPNVEDAKEIRDSLGDASEYKVQIKAPTVGNLDLTWTLADAFTVIGVNKDDLYVPGVNDYEDRGLKVVYDRDKKNFSFFLRNNELPTNGSMVVFTVVVSSHGQAAPPAELFIAPIKLPYTIVKPYPISSGNVLKPILNQNFVEVVINSPGADKVIINGEVVKKQEYTLGDKHFDDAYRVIVKGLKKNKETPIKFTIVTGTESIQDTIKVTYVPTNIPGAQYMEPMKKSHKMFDNALSLNFATGTSLIRKDYDVPEQYKNQVYANNDLLFAMANPRDGVVNRHDFLDLPANFVDEEVNKGRAIFEVFPDRFTQASPVFWIDPGLADNIEPPGSDAVYDPILYGNDPYQFPNAEVPSFMNREPERELVPSKVGELTLSYDADVTHDAGSVITVFRYVGDTYKTGVGTQGWENLGGVVDPAKHTITVPFDRFGYYVVAKLAYSYNDVVGHPYARDHIEAIFAKGIMNAELPNQSFGTDTYVSRGELARMLVKALDIPLDYDGPKHFNDIYFSENNVYDETALWDARYVETAARKGIVRGVAPYAFEGDMPVIRQDAAVMIAKALNLKLETDRAKIDKELAKYFKDWNQVEYYARPSVLAVAKKGLISGMPVNPSDPKTAYVFNPDANMLRGDAALIMSRVMVDMKKLPKL
ncbi:S-layer homology domain-containing protein [Paenibacillus marinisediminis]